MPTIHPSACIAPSAQIADDVTIGPYCVIGPGVSIASGCRLGSHVHIEGLTMIGARTEISPFASLGTPPQSVHYKGEATRLEIGDDCIIREHVTANIGTMGGRGVTRIGNNCFLMTGAHVGHDSIVGNHVTFANNATLGGHSEIGDHVFLGGLCAVHQFVRIGELAIIGGLVGAVFDVIPFAAVIGHRGELAGLNIVGLKRRNVPRASIYALRRAYRALFLGPNTLAERTERVAAEFSGDPNVIRIVDFIRAGGKRRLMTPRGLSDEEDDD
jgi:UDP-N-acetylglucosamine acyltransferase